MINNLLVSSYLEFFTYSSISLLSLFRLPIISNTNQQFFNPIKKGGLIV